MLFLSLSSSPSQAVAALSQGLIQASSLLSVTLSFSRDDSVVNREFTFRTFHLVGAPPGWRGTGVRCWKKAAWGGTWEVGGRMPGRETLLSEGCETSPLRRNRDPPRHFTTLLRAYPPELLRSSPPTPFLCNIASKLSRFAEYIHRICNMNQSSKEKLYNNCCIKISILCVKIFLL